MKRYAYVVSGNFYTDLPGSPQLKLVSRSSRASAKNWCSGKLANVYVNLTITKIETTGGMKQW